MKRSESKFGGIALSAVTITQRERDDGRPLASRFVAIVKPMPSSGAAADGGGEKKRRLAGRGEATILLETSEGARVSTWRPLA